MKKLLLAALLVAPVAAHAQETPTPGQSQFVTWMNSSLYNLLGQVDALKAQVAAKDKEIDDLHKAAEKAAHDKVAAPVLPPAHQPTEPRDATPHTVESGK